MTYIHPQSAEQRREALLARSQETFADVPQSFANQAFILSEQEALNFGEAISRRDQEAMFTTLEDVLVPAMVDYEASEPAEYIGVWNRAFSPYFTEGTTLADLLNNDDTRQAFNDELTKSTSHQFGLESTEYVKLLETVAVATMAKNGYRNAPESRKSRAGGSERALYNRSVTLLTMLADNPPGVRTVREGVLNTDETTLTQYMDRFIQTHSAQVSLKRLEDLTPDAIVREKANLDRLFADEATEHDATIEGLVHVLEWTMLTNREEEPSRTHARIKKIIAEQSETDYQRKKLEKDWCPERLDFLIEIAENAKRDGRNPSLLISNRFENGAGVYVAVELESPHDASAKIVFADNPIHGNALYAVDEVRLQNEGRPNVLWQEVLGASRRIARERGALRRFHTKNWHDIVPKMLMIGESHDTPAPTQAAQPEAPVSTPTTEIPLPDIQSLSLDELIEHSKRVQDRIYALAKATNTLIN